jgi:predicted regulator of Ras-like GTPase activity (Roadblock/LC7/MglB family)
MTPRSPGQDARSTPTPLRNEPSFDDAVSYVGEYEGVRLCWVVDAEGLPLAVWQRQQYSFDADYWAPVSIEGVDYHRQRLSAGGDCLPKRLDVRTDQGRLIMESIGDFWLGVLADPEADDLISVRLARACEMIANQLQVTSRKYAGTAEAHYV